MNNGLTEIGFVLDRSGSMSALRAEAIGGFNAFLEDQQKFPGQARLTLVLFDHEYLLVHNGMPLRQVVKLSEDTYVPRGATALLDAIARTIDDIGKRLDQTPESERPAKVIIAILTDGLENASNDYSRRRIREMIRHQQSKYSWQFLFLGANHDAILAGTDLGIPRLHTVIAAATPSGTHQAFSAIGAAIGEYRAGKADYANSLAKGGQWGGDKKELDAGA